MIRVGPGIRIQRAHWSVAEAEDGDTVELHALLDRPGRTDVGFRIFAGATPGKEPLAEIEAMPVEGSQEAIGTYRVEVPGEPLPESGDTTGPRPQAEREPDTARREGSRLCFEARVGKQVKASQALTLRHDVQIDFDRLDSGSALAGVDYLIVFSNGAVRRGKLDGGGRLEELGCPAGGYSVALKDHRFPPPFSWS